MRPRRRTGGARGLGSGGTGRGRGTRLGRSPGLDPGTESWGYRGPGEALVPKRRGAPQDCAGRGLLGRLRKEK